MVSLNKNAAQRQRAELIILARLLKPAAIVAGFDWPTQEPEMAKTHEIQELVEDVASFLHSYANGEV